MFDKTYKEDPTYFKELIAKVNAEVNFLGYLLNNGYKTVKSSSGSHEVGNGTDRIVLNIKREPVTYFNRNDSNDKGQFFKYLNKREPNFYRALENGLGIINRAYEIGAEHKIRKNKRPGRSLEDNYNIVSLAKDDYLVESRGLGRRTLKSPQFKDRIFNAVHKRKDYGRIFNIALPKFTVEGDIKNYMLLNRPFRSRSDKEIKKFRIFLNGEHRYLFVSNPDIEVDKIVLTESGIDAMSHYEVNQGKRNFYIALSGELDIGKWNELLKWNKKIDPDGTLKYAFAFDNDAAGYKYDLTVLSALINNRSDRKICRVDYKAPELTLKLCVGERELDELKIMPDLRKFAETNTALARLVQYSDRTECKIDLGDIGNEIFHTSWNELLRAMGSKMLGKRILVERPIVYKDWNQVLVFQKNRAIELAKSDIKKVLKYMGVYAIVSKGILPESANNRAKVESIKDNTLTCDIGNRSKVIVDMDDVKSLVGVKKKPRSKNAVLD